MTKYKEILKIKDKKDYTEEEKAVFFDRVWQLAFEYFEEYDEYPGDNDDEEFEFKEELKRMATNVVFPSSEEDDVLELIKELHEEE